MSPDPMEEMRELDEELFGDAQHLLLRYADFIRSVPVAEIERHPYLPEVEDLIARLGKAEWPAPEANNALRDAEDNAMWNALIDYAIEADDPKVFLRCWREGDFEACRNEWPDVPEVLFPKGDRK